MNWITTNIRFSEDEYMRLKLFSAKKRISLSAIVRQAVKKVALGQRGSSKVEAMRKLDRVAEIISKRVGKNWDSTKALREIRYHGT